MKLAFPVLILVFLVQQASAQIRRDVKLYAYARAVSGGVPPRISGAKQASYLIPGVVKEKYTYLIYLEGGGSKTICPLEMYIKGERTGVKTTAIKDTPVQLKAEGSPYSKPVLLVPKTRKQVYQLDPTAPSGDIKSTPAKRKAASNDVVVVYTYSGRIYYAVQKKFNYLEPVVLQ
jgi:hypothetical protein